MTINARSALVASGLKFDYANFGINGWGDCIQPYRYDSLTKSLLKRYTRNGQNRPPGGCFVHPNENVPTICVRKRSDGLFEASRKVEFVIERQPLPWASLAKIVYMLEGEIIDSN